MEGQLIKHNLVTSAVGTPLRRVLIRYLLILSTTILLAGSLISTHIVALAAPPPQPVSLRHSVLPQIASDHLLGQHNPTAPLTIELVLHPNNQAAIDSLVANLYNPKSPQFHKWLPSGGFAARFAPTASQLAAAKTFLSQAGLHMVPGAPGAFLLRAMGPSGQVAAAFHTSINDYQGKDGTRYFANAQAIQIPANLSGVINGVVGLENLTRLHPHYQRPPHVAGQASPHYGAGPFGTGLTPSQIAGIYQAKPLYSTGDLGAGKTLGLFELSGYTQSDISVYCSQFALTCPTLTNINVDGGPTDNGGAGEVELDIELQTALAPAVTGILVYNAPNSGAGVTDQYAQIASDNVADSISTSWGLCEAFSSSSVMNAEYTSFQQMASQGQTIFAASGDSGAFDCIRFGDGSNQVDDPASNPFMTGVGGTSLGSFDPGSNPNPSYPATGESVWNNGCTSSGCNGAGGGGNSTVWAQPFYQSGPGVSSSFSQSGAYCNQSAGVPCREVPDVSMNADNNTGYAIYCTDFAGCGGGGWQIFGGTSCAAPLWAAIVALRDSFRNNRLGTAGFALYSYITPRGYHYQFHDVTSGDNGFYPAAANYDLATGIGTPRIFYQVTTVL